MYISRYHVDYGVMLATCMPAYIFRHTTFTITLLDPNLEQINVNNTLHVILKLYMDITCICMFIGRTVHNK